MSAVLALTCRECGWRPGEDQELQVVADHFLNEHGLGQEDIALDLTAYCPRDDTRLAVRMTGIKKNGRKVTTYDCPRCLRTYRVNWSNPE